MSNYFQNEALETAYRKFENQWNSSHEFEVLTSGSTGEPKKIKLLKSQLVLSANKTIDFFNLKSGINALVCLSLETIAGKMMLARAFVGNWNLKIVEPKANPLKDLNEEFDFVALVPYQLEHILAETPGKLKLLKTIIVGGAPVSSKLIIQLKEHKISVYQTFGMTETVSHIALRKIGFEAELRYQTVKGVHVSGQDGNLIIHYPEMFPNEIQTNDLVEIKSPTEFEWLGRKDFIINSGGIKLNPENIEEKLSSLIPNDFFVIGIPDESLGQKLALILESESQYILEKNNLLKILNKFEVPKIYAFVKRFSRTDSGKIQRLETLKKISLDDWKAFV